MKRLPSWIKGLLTSLGIVTLFAGNILPTYAAEKATLDGFPHETRIEEDKVLMKGFDLNEYGGNDANCSIPVGGQPRNIHIGEVVSSPSEGCRQVLEWSLKQGTETIIAGTYALEPGEWFYVPKAAAGDFSDPRFVGTLWTYPKGWNAHRMAFYMAAARDERDGTLSVVGLSPTDDYVLGLAGVAHPGGGGAPGSSDNSEDAQDQSPEENLTCTVTSSKSLVNVRRNPSTTATIVRKVATDSTVAYQVEVGDWKKLSDTEFILGALCVAQENDEADG